MKIIQINGWVPRYFVSGAILLFALLHLYQIDAPPNGYHQWRESDTAAVILNFYQENRSPLVPLTNELSSSETIAKIELPIYCYISALGYFLLGPNHIAAHLLTIIAACLTIWFFYRIAVFFTDQTVAAFSVWAIAFSPLFFYYSYKIMPDILMIFFLVASIYLFLCFIEYKTLRYIVISAICLSLAVSTKPFVLSIYLLFVYLMLRKEMKIKEIISVLPFHFLIAVFPLLAWMIYSGWLTGRSVLVLSFYQYLFSALFFKKFFLQWPYELWIGWVMLPAFIYGLYHIVRKKINLIYFVWILAAFLAMVLMARYSRQHDYYSLIFVPPMAGITGFGLAYLYQGGRKWRRILLLALLILAPLGAFLRVEARFGAADEFYAVRRATANIIPPGAKVIVEDNTRGAIRLYQMNRKGWYVNSGDEYERILKVAQMGAEYIILNRPKEQYHDSLGLIASGPAARLGSFYCYRLTLGNSLKNIEKEELCFRKKSPRSLSLQAFF